MKKIIVASLAASTLGLATVSAGAALAHQGSGSDDFAGKLSERFSLNETEVETFLEEEQQARQAEREQNREAHMQGLVDEGVLTEEQRDAFEVKQNEMREARQAIRDQDLTRDEMHEQMETLRDEFQSWAEDQGIDLDSIRPEGKGGPGGRMHGRH